MLNRIRIILPILLFSVFLFVAMPFIQYRAALDPELSPRFFITALFCVFYLLFILLFPGKPGTGIQIPFLFRILILAQMFWMLTTIIWSVNQGDAAAEWFRLALLWIFFLIALHVLSKGLQNIYLLIRFSLVAILVFTCFAIPQVIQLWIEKKKDAEPFHVNLSIASTLSNKNFFAEVIVLLIPFYLVGIWTEKKWWRLLFLLATILSFAWIALLQTLSTWVALCMGGIALVFIYYFFKPVQQLIDSQFSIFKKKWITVIPIILILFSVLFFFARTGNLNLLSTKLERAEQYWNDKSLLDSTSAINDNSVYERILMWRNSVSLIQEHPIAGAGLNNWKIEHAKYGIGGTTFLNSGFLHFEQPHNDFLLVWSEQGPLGLLMYLFFFFYLFQLILRSLKSKLDDKQKKILLLLFLGLIGFMMISFFGYPRARIYVMLLLMLASAMVIAISNSIVVEKKKINQPGKMLITLLLIISVISSYAALKRIQGEVHIKQAQIAQLNKNYSRMFREANRSQTFFYPIDLMSTPTSWYMGMASFYDGNVPLAREHFEKAVQVNPFHILVLNDLGTCYEQNHEIENAIDCYRQALSITPGFIQGQLNLSAAYFNNKQIDSAFVVISKVNESRLDAQDGKSLRTYRPAILYGLAARDSSKFENTEERIKYLKFIDNDPLLREIYQQSDRSSEKFLAILMKRFNSSSQAAQ